MSPPPHLDAQSLIGANVHIDGRVQVDHPELAWVNVKRGQEVHLMLRYKINEGSVEREHYRFQVRSEVGGIRPEPEQREHRDQPGAHDVWLGTLGHRYRFDTPGSYEGTFEATIEYGAKGWLSGKQVSHRAETVIVPVRIDVI